MSEDHREGVMSKVRVTRAVVFPFEDSGWELAIRDNGEDVTLDLHWNGKPQPTHRVTISGQEWRRMLSSFGWRS